jgi:hypothetical protein
VVGYPYLTGLWKGCPSSDKEGLTAGKGLITYKTTSKDKPYQDCCPPDDSRRCPVGGMDVSFGGMQRAEACGSRLMEKEEHA